VLPTGAPDFATIGVSVNGGTVATIEVVSRDPTPFGPHLEWETFELVNGWGRGIVLGETFELSFQNYVGYKDLLPGRRNELGVSVVQNQELVSRVTVSSGPLILRTREGPPDLDLEDAIVSADNCFDHQRVVKVSAESSGRPIQKFGLELLTPPNAVVLGDPVYFGDLAQDMDM